MRRRRELIITLLAFEGLPMDDVAETGRRFFAFSDANGSIIGYGGCLYRDTGRLADADKTFSEAADHPTARHHPAFP